ncbi:hypothetical protein IMSAGC019_02052 [Lachnospiraceae bacterium]|nr:hypothetical protein IMSAGC019_02052 [Lachnospiraceae bacterium]
MHKKLKGYFTVEAAFILPVVLFLYLMIILAALFLYCRCLISQDNFLLGLRAGEFTWGEEAYGEVIYGQQEGSFWPGEAYVRERQERRKTYYPFFPALTGDYGEFGDYVSVKSRQKGLDIPIIKKVQRINPVAIIREGRKK